MLMEAPVCLIENSGDSELQVNPLALDILNGINQPLVVVAIVGHYRTGKSYLMNQLAGQQKGFSLGSTIQAETKGIWMWCVPHPLNPNQTLVLLDTEGLGDVEKGDTKNDIWIFTLTILLSSTFIYNSIGFIDEDVVNKLHVVSELTDLIKVKTKRPKDDDDDDEDGGQFARFFPHFIWVVRDFTLELKINNQDTTEKGYLEHALELKKGTSRRVDEHNRPRLCIKSYFPARDCFLFDCPASKDKLKDLETLQESDLSPEFVEKTKQFREFILRTSKVKRVPGGSDVNGSMFSSLVQNYVETIRSGAVPCIENAVLAMAKIENQRAVETAVKHYTTRMQELVKFPVEDQELSRIHGQCEEEAIKLFMDASFKDEDHTYYKQFLTQLEEHHHEMQKQNEESSLDKCSDLLRDLSATLSKNLKDGVYAKPGGYEAYNCDREEVVNKYKASPNKGVKAQEALERFLVSRSGEADVIMKADQSLSDAEKQLAGEKEKTILKEQEIKVAEEKNAQMKQALTDQQRTFEENVKQMQDKMKVEMENYKKETQKEMENKMSVQMELQLKGHKERARLLEEDVARLRKENEERMKAERAQNLVGGILSGVASIISAAANKRNCP